MVKVTHTLYPYPKIKQFKDIVEDIRVEHNFIGVDTYRNSQFNPTIKCDPRRKKREDHFPRNKLVSLYYRYSKRHRPNRKL